jgi:hypothetical protein
VPEDVAAAWELGSDQVDAFARGAAPVTDDVNLLATRSVRIGNRTLSTTRCAEMLAPHDPLESHADDLDRIYLAHRLASIGFKKRAETLARADSNPVRRLTALGWIKSVVAPDTAAETFRRALAADPGAQAARFGLVRMARRRLEAGEPEVVAWASELQGMAAAVAAGWQHASRREWAELRGLEARLTEGAPRELSRIDALRLRIRWRAEIGDAAEREAGIALANELLALSWEPESLVVGARAFASAGRPNDAIFILDFMSRSSRPMAVSEEALALLDELRAGSKPERWDEIQTRLSGKRAASRSPETEIDSIL